MRAIRLHLTRHQMVNKCCTTLTVKPVQSCVLKKKIFEASSFARLFYHSMAVLKQFESKHWTIKIYRILYVPLMRLYCIENQTANENKRNKMKLIICHWYCKRIAHSGKQKSIDWTSDQNGLKTNWKRIQIYMKMLTFRRTHLHQYI